MSGSAVVEKMPAGLVVGVDRNLHFIPLIGPDMKGDDMSEQLKVSDLQVTEMGRDSAREILMIFMVVGTETGESVVPTIGGRVEGDFDSGLGHQEGHSVPGLDGGLPPPDVGVEVFRQVYGFVESGGKPFSGQTSVKEESASEEHISGIKHFAAQHSEFVF